MYMTCSALTVAKPFHCPDLGHTPVSCQTLKVGAGDKALVRNEKRLQ